MPFKKGEYIYCMKWLCCELNSYLLSETLIIIIYNIHDKEYMVEYKNNTKKCNRCLYSRNVVRLKAQYE